MRDLTTLINTLLLFLRSSELEKPGDCLLFYTDHSRGLRHVETGAEELR